MVATTVVINRTADDNQPITAKITHQQSLYTSGYYCNFSDLQSSDLLAVRVSFVPWLELGIELVFNPASFDISLNNEEEIHWHDESEVNDLIRNSSRPMAKLQFGSV
ncbi:hypothetical protein T05_13303 [Trichinella murrelli]|uniref:Uncharacterized protein n=1 Tax=Trichinella murrelli TaxID=144512 RepID=A0A0V0TA88_9BILA|nr:hypothetical protein T05_13303 [Trichinella murrelli]